MENGEKETEALSREEILNKSREENKHGDERERSFYLKANSLGFAVGLLIAGIVILVTVITGGRLPVEILMITCAMQATQSFIIAIGNRKIRKMYLIIGIAESGAFVILCVLWILQLCGVII